MQLPLLLFLTLTIIAKTEPKTDHWKQLLWENGIKVLSESENPYKMLQTVVHAIESEDETTKIEPIINEILTRILVLNSDRTHHAVEKNEGKKGLRLLALKRDSDDDDENVTEQTLMKTGDKIMDFIEGMHNKTLASMNNNFTDSGDNVLNWLKNTQKRFNEFANSTLGGKVEKLRKENGEGVSGALDSRDATGEKKDEGGFLSHRRGNFFGQILEELFSPGENKPSN